MDLEAHRHNLQATYRYMKNDHLIYCGILLVFIFLIVWNYSNGKDITIIIANILGSLGSAYYIFAYLRYRVNVSTTGISVRYWGKETFIAWQDIQALQTDFLPASVGFCLTGAGNVSVSINYYFSGYAEILESVLANRPDFLKTLAIRQFHSRSFARYSLLMIILFFIGGIGLQGESSWNVAGLAVCWLIASGIAVYTSRSVRAIEIKGKALIIDYLLKVKRIPASEISGIVRNKGLVTRSGKVIQLGKVREVQGVMYDTLLEWWRANRRPTGG